MVVAAMVVVVLVVMGMMVEMVGGAKATVMGEEAMVAARVAATMESVVVTTTLPVRSSIVIVYSMTEHTRDLPFPEPRGVVVLAWATTMGQVAQWSALPRKLRWHRSWKKSNARRDFETGCLQWC